ncbi:MAG TPA: hypothetical protein VFB66_15030 [Tepidisphaeraceae bacterium]|nr:hypothetical protein [Tepidisphaeraceae bacterium]
MSGSEDKKGDKEDKKGRHGVRRTCHAVTQMTEGGVILLAATLDLLRNRVLAEREELTPARGTPAGPGG